MSHQPVSLRRLVEAPQRVPFDGETRRERAQERRRGEREDPGHRAAVEQRAQNPDQRRRTHPPEPEEKNIYCPKFITTCARQSETELKSYTDSDAFSR